MAKTYLSGNGPDESEPLTESQINDARRPSSMAMSDNILRDADDDETPAIERQISHANLVSFSENVGTRNLKADPEFEAAELKRRAEEQEKKNAKPKPTPKKQKILDEQKSKEKAAKSSNPPKNPEADKKPQKPAEPTPEKPDKKFDFASLYPEPAKTVGSESEADWQKRKDDTKPIPERARIEDKIPSHMNRIFISYALQIIAILLAAFTVLPLKLPAFLIVIIIGISAAAIILSSFVAFFDFKKKSALIYHDSERGYLFWASVIPFLLLRFILVDALLKILPTLPLNIQQGIALLGIPAGAYWQYQLLGKNKIPYSQKYTIANTSIFAVIIILNMLSAGPIGAMLQLSNNMLFILAYYLVDKAAGDMTKTIVYWRKQFSPKSQW